MGNTHGRRSSQQRKHRKRPHSIAVNKPESWPSSKPSEMSRDSRQGSLRRRYSESGNYSYKTPWPLPLSEAVFLPEYDSKQPVKISDFEILATVGKGAFAHVLQVKNKQTEQLFAIKVKLGNFPFVVRTWYTWQTKHNLFIVSDFVDGSDLYTLWRQEKRLNDTTVKIYSAELAITLGILYRDLKLENILIDEEGHIKLVDFGLAKLVKPRERTGTICGTLQYMVDWWSLGVVMYTLLVGKNPYPAKQEHCSQLSVVEDAVEIDFPSDLSDDAVSIITQLLQKDPSLRLSNVDSLKTHRYFEGLSFEVVLQKEFSEEQAYKGCSQNCWRGNEIPRPLSWASPGSFTVQDKTHMDWLVADLGSLDALNLNGKSQEARRTECLVSP
ncbi:Serine/threonine-protein kinase AtPK1/AtPK6 [Acropora cervicornis]|uniref:Serine/threonine-protein kinase AtPK1/AtPK6 n=1 Tax=Acropora cervicornis TaxID=6130 RepID=A0AAD9QJD4_ACRCE|nr:Serine/threonine-protein kinase AtPK1/AtPK6 [Acropora cervicornis]